MFAVLIAILSYGHVHEKTIYITSGRTDTWIMRVMVLNPEQDTREYGRNKLKEMQIICSRFGSQQMEKTIQTAGRTIVTVSDGFWHWVNCVVLENVVVLLLLLI